MIEGSLYGIMFLLTKRIEDIREINGKKNSWIRDDKTGDMNMDTEVEIFLE
jgi:hypothetical protein